MKKLCSAVGISILLAMPAAHAALPGTSLGTDIVTQGTITAENIRNKNTGDSYFVYQPGGTTANNVYGNFAELYEDLQNVKGQKYIEIDTSITDPAVIPAGTYNLDNAVLMARQYTAAGFTDLDLADGVVFEKWGGIQNNLHVHSQSSAPIFTVANGQNAGFLVSFGSTIDAQNGAPVFHVENGGGLYNLFELGAGLANSGSTPVVQVDAGGTYLTTLSNIGLIGQDTVAGAGTFYVLNASPSSEVGTQVDFTGTFVNQISAKAELVNYANGVSNLVATTVQAAIDELAAAVAKLSSVTSGILSFGIIFPGQCESDTMIVLGAEEGDTLALGLPSNFGFPDYQFVTAIAFVSASDEVTVRLCNGDNGVPVFTGPETINVRLMK